jgi:hypothetical protein
MKAKGKSKKAKIKNRMCGSMPALPFAFCFLPFAF